MVQAGKLSARWRYTTSTQETIRQRIARFLGQLEVEIYRLYGVSRF
jgi:hypothetical protein